MIKIKKMATNGNSPLLIKRINKRINKLKIFLEYDNKRLEYCYETNKTLKEFKEDIFYPLMSDTKFIYNNFDLSKLENEKLFNLFKDKSQVNLQVVQKNETSFYNIEGLDNKNGDFYYINYSNGINNNSNQITFAQERLIKEKERKVEINSKTCRCGKFIIKSFCRQCIEFLCDVCIEQVIYFN